jgi:subtilisin family serine protease
MSLRSLVLIAALSSGFLAGFSPAQGAVPEAVLARPALQKIHPSLRAPGVQANVLIRLQDPPLVARLGRNAKQLGYKLSRNEQLAYARQMRAKQVAVAKRIQAGGGQVVGYLTASQNAVLAVLNTDQLPAISELVTVSVIRPVIDSQIQLVSTVPHIGATPLHQSGVTGEGIRVAVLDSGIDYTHRNFGGPGTAGAYAQAYGTAPADPLNTTRDGFFPTEKVIGGWDFVGEVWPNGIEGDDGPIEPDEDPIDFGTHGSHVADIIAGASTDGTHKGVAPGAKLYAFKVCSAVSTACNGFAILLGLDACLHPDNPALSLEASSNGQLFSIVENPVDVINLSLGSGYGQIQDDKAYVVQLLSDFGITVVTAAGNDGDRPYVVDSPSVAPGSISVAETQVPDSKAFTLKLTAVSNRGGVGTLQTIINTADIAWAPVDQAVQGVGLVLGRGCPGDVYPVLDSEIAGKVAVVERGLCSVSEKVDRAARAGAVGVVIINNVAGDPPTFSQGAGSVFVPSLVVARTDGYMLRSLLGRSPRAQISYGPSLFTPLVGSMASTSSRGPSVSFQTIKPDIGAPGASVSAEAGTGAVETPFGGTSGATPVIAGAAALLQSASLAESGLFWAPWAIKALLMNNAEPNILINPVSQPGVLAPITRVGAGEVRVDRALEAKAFAVVVEPPIEDGAPLDIQASLSFGYVPSLLPGPIVLTKTIEVVNLAPEPRTFTVSRSFRYVEDQASGAVEISLSAPTLDVPSLGQGEVTVTLTLDPTRLPEWTLNGGSQGGNGSLLRAHEFDGYIQLQDAEDTLTLPWHVLPRKAADVALSAEVVEVGGTVQLSNPGGAVAGVTEVFALGGTSPIDYPKPDTFGFNEALPDLKAAGVRMVGTYVEFALAFHHEWSHPATPVGGLVFLDADFDGVEDFMILTTEATGAGVAEVVVDNLNTGETVGIFPLDADLNASAMILRVPLSVLGLTATSTVDWVAVSWDNYFTGNISDIIFDAGSFFLRHTPSTPRYAIDSPSTKTVAMGGTTPLTVSSVSGGDAASPSQTGFLLVHRNALPDRGSEVLEVVPSEDVP